MPPIIPTVGRVVLFRGVVGADPCPALITRVHGPYCLNLQVLPDGAPAFCASSVTHADDGDSCAPSWSWMPYQKAVAAGDIAPTRHAVEPVSDTTSDKTSSSLAASDAECAAVAVAPRISLKSMEARIRAEHTFTAATALSCLGHPVMSGPFDVLTICVMLLDNGWTLVGKSAPASAENFDRALGKKLAREDCIRQLWPLEGYLLRDRLAKDA